MRRWRGMSKPYQVMLDLVRWRKQTAPLNDNLLLGQIKSTDCPALAAALAPSMTGLGIVEGFPLASPKSLCCQALAEAGGRLAIPPQRKALPAIFPPTGSS